MFFLKVLYYIYNEASSHNYSSWNKHREKSVNSIYQKVFRYRNNSPTHSKRHNRPMPHKFFSIKTQSTLYHKCNNPLTCFDIMLKSAYVDCSSLDGNLMIKMHEISVFINILYHAYLTIGCRIWPQRGT